MSPNPAPEFTAKAMLSLRKEAEALKIIVGQLKVREMGPADHIRTKHEVKAWLETNGDLKEAEAIVTRAQARRKIQETQAVTQRMSERQQRGQSITGD